MGRVGGVGRLQAPLWDLVQAVGGGSHVLIHAVQVRVCARTLLGLPQLQATPRALPVLPPTPVSILRVAGQCGCQIKGSLDKYMQCSSSLETLLSLKLIKAHGARRVDSSFNYTPQSKCYNNKISQP